MAMKGDLEYSYGCYSASGGKDDMGALDKERLTMV
jgi:hypothetical protein